MREKKPSAKMVRLPASTHAKLIEVREMMGHHGAYWAGAGGKIVHGPLSDAPLHLVVDWCLQQVAEVYSDPDAVIEASDARRAYLEGFKEDPED